MNEVNHRYDDFGRWVEYTGFRYKDLYNIKTKKGEVVKWCLPNGTSFWPLKSRFGIPDDEVSEIQLVPGSEVVEDPDEQSKDKVFYWLNEQDRAEKNCEQFRPHCNETQHLEVTVKVRINNACARDDAFLRGGYAAIAQEMIDEEGIAGIVDLNDVEVVKAKEVKV